MRFLKEGLWALALNLALATPVLGQESKLVSSKPPVAAVQTNRNANLEGNYNVLENYLVRFSREFLDDMSKESKSVGKNLRKYGDEFKNDYLFIHQSCLDLAKKSLYGEVREEDYLHATKEICKKQKKYSSSVDYSDKDVIAAEKEWVKERTEFFKKLLEAEGRFNSGEEIIRKVYSKKGYEEYVKKQNGKARELYGEIRESLSYLASIFGGEREVDCVRDNVGSLYQKSIEKLYGE